MAMFFFYSNIRKDDEDYCLIIKVKLEKRGNFLKINKCYSLNPFSKSILGSE